MAKKVLLVDDLDKNTPADETVTFALDGASYEIDLTRENAAALRDALAVYVAHAERVGPRRTRRESSSSASSGSSSSAKSAKIREWARGRGYEVSERGRIPADVKAAYDAAH